MTAVTTATGPKALAGIEANEVGKYGFSVSFGTGLRGVFNSIVHWSARYDAIAEKALLVRHCRANLDSSKIELDDQIKNLCMETGDYEVSDWDLARVIVSANEQNNNAGQSTAERLLNAAHRTTNLQQVLALLEGGASISDISSALQHGVSLSTENLPDAIEEMIQQKSLLSSKLWQTLYNNFPFEFGLAVLHTTFALFPWFGELVPFALNNGSGEMFWPGIFALSTAIALLQTAPAISDGAKKAYEEGGVISFFSGFAEGWNKMVRDENTLHPILEGAASGLFVTIPWAIAGMYAKTFTSVTGLAYGHKVKYAIMNVMFGLWTDLCAGKIGFKTFMMLPYQIILGFLRGWIKDLLKFAPLGPILKEAGVSAEVAKNVTSTYGNVTFFQSDFHDVFITLFSKLAEIKINHTLIAFVGLMQEKLNPAPIKED